MTATQTVEVAVAAALFAFGVLLYRRRPAGERYGSQGAMLLFVVSALIAVHGLGLMQYRPSAAEAEMLAGGGR